jgi:hypothetical protein
LADTNPTTHGITAPPTLLIANIGPAIRPAHCPKYESDATVIGNTDDSPSPEIASPASTGNMLLREIIRLIPDAAIISPHTAVWVADSLRSTAGATERPSINEAQNTEGAATHIACGAPVMRFAYAAAQPPTDVSAPTYRKNRRPTMPASFLLHAPTAADEVLEPCAAAAGD